MTTSSHPDDGEDGNASLTAEAARVPLPAQPCGGVLELEQRLLLPGRALEGVADVEGERGGEEAPAQVADLLLGLSVEAVGDAYDVPHEGLDVGGERLGVLPGCRGLGGRAVLEPLDGGDEVGLGAHDAGDAEPLLALADEEEAVVGEALVLDDLADAPHLGGRAARAGEDDAEAERSSKMWSAWVASGKSTSGSGNSGSSTSPSSDSARYGSGEDGPGPEPDAPAAAATRPRPRRGAEAWRQGARGNAREGEAAAARRGWG
nr:unnamed protein product [Digitaria exilis]